MSYLYQEIVKKGSDILKYFGVINYLSDNYDYYIYPITETIFLSNLPREIHLSKIQKYNFEVILSIMRKNEYGTHEIQWIKNTSIIHHFIETIDYTPPSLDNYHEFLNLIKKYSGKKILIHCYAGKGRSNCMIVKYLMHYQGLTPSQAIDEIIRLNPRSNMNYNQKKSLYLLPP